MVSPSSRPLSGSSFVVTGGSGLVGRAVVAALTEMGASVTSLQRSKPAAGMDGVRYVQADLRRPGSLAGLVRRGDTVVHLAAAVGGIQLQQAGAIDVLLTNRDITRNVLGAAAEGFADRVFVASSAVVYARSDADLIREDAPLRRPGSDRITAYEWSKIDDEVVARLYHDAGAFDLVVGRLTNVFGEHGSFDPGRSSVVHDLIRRACTSDGTGALEVWGDGSAVRSFLYEADAGAAVASVTALGASGGTYNIDSGEAVTIRRLATDIRDLVDPSLELRFRDDMPEGTPRRVLDGTALAGLGFRCSMPFERALERTVRAYQHERSGTDVETR
jgi:GDP-L-fucose synthase